VKWYSAPRRPQSRVETLWDDTTRSRCTERSSVAPWLTCANRVPRLQQPFLPLCRFFRRGGAPVVPRPPLYQVLYQGGTQLTSLTLTRHIHGTLSGKLSV